MKLFNNDVYVIGADHHNTLAVLRCFGRKKYNVKLVVLDDSGDALLKKSRFAKDVTILKSSSSALLDYLKAEASRHQNGKGILIPCCDLAEYTIDWYAQELKDSFIFPSFKNQYGKVSQMMDKLEQKKWADEHGIQMARTWRLDLATGTIPSDLVYPCILKPEVSAKGSKSDIATADNKSELYQRLENLKSLGYTEVLCQEQILMDYEACAFGYIPPVDSGLKHKGIIIRKIYISTLRSMFYSVVVDNHELTSLNDKICGWLQTEGFSGLYDMDYFVTPKNLFLNEINFRHSGNGFGLVNLGVDSPIEWALSSIGMSFVQNDCNFTGKYLMDDTAFLGSVRDGRVGLIKFIKCFFQSRNFAIINRHDIRGTVGWYLGKLSGRA